MIIIIISSSSSSSSSSSISITYLLLLQLGFHSVAVELWILVWLVLRLLRETAPN